MTGWLSSAALASIQRVRWLRGFITVPGMISLFGIALAFATTWLDRAILQMPPGGLSLYSIEPDNVRPLLTAIAGSAMAALSLVYSSVLVVFTLAAGTLGPRLLLRFAEDRTSQVAVGILGATFLFCLIALRNQPANVPGEITVNFAIILATACVIMLLFFINSTARKVTIDEEIGQISKTLDRELDRAIASTHSVERSAIVRPPGPETALISEKKGYLNRIEFEAIAKAAAECNAFVDFDIQPGSFAIEGQRIGTIIGRQADDLAPIVHHLIVFGERRTTTDDLYFSINLLVEIGLRALSPGVNDTFTAISCADRLAGSLLRARRAHLQIGLHLDEAGAARVTTPQLTAADLIETAFTPLRRASSNNMLMCRHLIQALGILGQGEGLPEEGAVREQLKLVQAEFEASHALEADKAVIRELTEYTLAHSVGRPLVDNAAR